MATLDIRDLHVSVNTDEGPIEILRGVDLTISSNETHAIMGPNGSGKSTLAYSLAGHPKYVVTQGSVTLDGVDVLAMPGWQRAQAGLHLVMQYPTEVPGVLLEDVMAEAFAARGRTIDGLEAALIAESQRINFDPVFLHRALNVDLSGGEKKRNETLQLAVLQPKIAILDELDSGLDIDALRDCARRVEDATNETGLGVLAITHYNRLLEELRPDTVHILVKGRIVAKGGPELADVLERDGYAAFTSAEPEVDESSASSLDDLFKL